MKRYRRLILGIGSLVVIVVLVLLFQRKDSDKPRPVPRSTRQTITTPSVPPVSSPPTRSGAAAPPPIERGKGVAVMASSRMVEQRAVEFSNLVNTIWSAELGTIFAAGDGAGDASIKVPTGMQVNALEQALSRCAMSLLLWDEDVNQNTIKALKDYCETGGWLVFVSCPWIGSAPKSSPAELLGPRSFEGIAYVGAASQDRKAFALLKHPSLPELPVGERLRVYLQSSKALSGGEGRKIPLIRFEDPALRGITIQAMGHGGVVELNWDCPAGGRIGETDSQEFIKTVLAWFAAKDTWKEPAEQPGVSLKVIARTPAGDPAPGAQIAVKVHTDWAKPLDQQVVTTDENGEADIPAKAPAIYTASAAGEGYSSDTLALGRLEEGTGPEPLVVIVRPSLRIVGTAVYTGEKTGPASEVEVDLLPSSRARGMDVASAATDKEGRFAFDRVPGGRPYLLRCETEEWASLEEIDLPESADTGTFEVTLSLKKLVAIDGRVVEEGEEQKPIEGATVHVQPCRGVKALPLFSQHFPIKSTSSKSNGQFELLLLPDMVYKMRAEALGYRWREQGTDRTKDGWLEARAPATEILTLSRGTNVRGIVHFPSGEPAPGTRVVLEAVDRGFQIQVSGPRGEFCFQSALLRENPQLGQKSLWISAERDSFRGFREITVPASQADIEVELIMQGCPIIRGLVSNLEGEPLMGALVRYTSGDARTVRSDERGLFEIPWYADLSISKEGYAPARVDHDEIKVSVENDSLLHVVLPRAGGSISGKAVLHNSIPLCNETVDLVVTSSSAPGLLTSQTKFVLGDQGEFRIEGIPVEGRRNEVFGSALESCDLCVVWYPDPKAPELRLTSFVTNIPFGSSDVLVRFEPFLELRGRLVNGGNGAAIPEGWVSIARTGESKEIHPDLAGEFAFHWMSPGEYVLKAQCAGFFPLERKVNITRENGNLGAVFLHSAIIVRGQVLQQDLPVEDAEVRFWVCSENFVATMTDSAGRFALTAMCPQDDAEFRKMTDTGFELDLVKDGAFLISYRYSYAGLAPDGTMDLGMLSVK